MENPHAPSFQASNTLGPAQSPGTAQSLAAPAIADDSDTFPPVPVAPSWLRPFSPPLPISTHGAFEEYFTPPELCRCPSNGRNLVVCIDGTSNQYGEKNTNVVELYSRLSKNPNEQLTYYSSGIGTYAKPSLRTSTFIGSWKRALGYRLDLVFAWRFERILWGAYQWLSENYEEGDRIFVFGFSRGAYQVRVLSAMIEAVGLIHKGNQDQIPFAFELYNESGKVLDNADLRRATRSGSETRVPSKAEQKASNLLLQFKKTFSRTVKVHFVGAWDTVSSVGILRGKTFPGTTRGMGHVCYFRHALALHEQRLKFQPEFACGGLGPRATHIRDSKLSPSTSEAESIEYRLAMPHTKEVWFAGSHSQVYVRNEIASSEFMSGFSGGGSEENPDLNQWGPSLRWIGAEATIAGLQFDTDVTGWKAQPSAIRQSLTAAWRLLEIMPFKRLRYGEGNAKKVASSPNIVHRLLSSLYVNRKRTRGGLDRTTYVPNLARPRRVQPGQLIHETAFQYERVDSLRARLPREWSWDKSDLGMHDRLENDDYEVAQSLVHTLWEQRSSPQNENVSKLWALIQTGMGRSVLRVLVNDWPSAEMVLTYMMNQLMEAVAAESDTPAVNQVLARMCSTVFQALEIVKPDLQWDHQPSRASRGQIGDVSEKDASYCTLTAAKSSADRVRSVARVLSNIDRVVARRFMLSLGKAEISCLSGESSSSECFIALAVLSNETLAVASDESTIRLCDLPAATMQLHAKIPSSVKSLAASSDGQVIASGCSDGVVRMWKASVAVTSLSGHSDWVRSVAISSDDSFLLSGSDDKTLRLWALGTGLSVGRPMEHPDWVRCATFSSTNIFVASGCDDAKIRIWDTASNALIIKLSEHTEPILAIAISSNDQLFASGAQDNEVHLWRLRFDIRGETLEPGSVLKLRGHNDYVRGVAFAQDSEHLASCSDDGVIRIWDTSVGKCIRVLAGHTNAVTDVKYLPDGKRLASCSYDRTVRVWDATDAWTRYDSEEAAETAVSEPSTAPAAASADGVAPVPELPVLAQSSSP